MANSNTDLTQNTMEPVIVQEIDQVSSEINIPAKDIRLQDPYNEDESEQKFLHSKPTCFIIMGKPGSGKTTLAQRFAQYWRCEFLNASMLLSEMLRSSDESVNPIWQILSKGEQLSEEMVFHLLEEKIKSPEVRHHGYILDDYPNICEDYMNIQDQFERMKTWKLTPDFIINLRIPDDDLLSRRISQRIDPQTGNIYTEEVYNYVKPPKKEPKNYEEEAEEGVEEEEEEGEETEELSSEIIKNLLKRPEDLPEEAARSIEKYKSNMLRIMEEFMIDHDRDNIIELDANQPVEVLVQQIITKLQIFGLCPAVVLQRLFDEEEEEAGEDMDTEDMLKTYGTKKTLAAQYLWKRSRWGRFCPVALYEGNMIPGKAEYAVSFLDKMYFLSSMEAMDKFLRNPRPYLLRPQPKPPCKISVLGMPKSGKTSLCYLLAYKYQAKVVSIQDKLDKLQKEREEEKLNSWKQECMQDAIETVKNKVKKNILQEFKTKRASSKHITVAAVEKDAEVKSPEGEDEEKNLETDEQDQDANEDAENKQSVLGDIQEKTEEDEVVEEEEEPSEDQKQSAQLETNVDRKSSRGDNKALSGFDLTPKMQEMVDDAMAAVDANHPDVVELIDKLLKKRGKVNISVSAEEQFDMLYDAVFEIEKNYEQMKNSHTKNGGWILDDCPSSPELWQVCVEKNWLPDNIICLVDESKGHNWLMKKWFEHHPEFPKVEETNVEAESINTETTEAEPKEVNAEKSVTELAEEGEGEETTAKAEEFETTETESKLMLEEEGSTETLSVQETKEPTQTGESTETETPKKADAAKVPKKTVKLPKPALKYKESLKKKAAALNNVVSTITSITNLDPLSVEINDQTVEDVLEKIVADVEKPLQYHPIEYGLVEMEEDDELYEEEENEDEENEEVEEEEEEENINHSHKRHLGNTSYFCPVMLEEKGILCTGKPENASKFANKLYYMSSSTALEQFLMNPYMYAVKDNPPKPPAIRLSIVGVHGSGKTVYGRYLARKLGIFHICFHEKMQEMILRKTGKKVGPNYGEGDSASEDEDSDLEEEKDPDKMTSEEEDSEFGELTEEEEFIKASLEGESPLPIEIIESIISPWWFQEPYKSTGFILEGFPRYSDEVTAFQEFGLWFDAVIILNIEDTDVVARLLPPKIEEWKVKKEKKSKQLQKKKEKAKKLKELKMKKRREELEKELEERKQARQEAKETEKAKEKTKEIKEKELVEAEENEGGGEEDERTVEDGQTDEFNEEDDEMDIEMILLEEFQQEEGEEEELGELEEESEEDAYDKIYSEISEQYEVEASKVANVQESLEDTGIPRIVIETGRRQHIVNYVLNKSLRTYVDYRESIFERVYPVSEGMARQLLNTGYKQPSCLGYWCPVSLQENVSIQAINNSNRNERYPCIYRQHIYFLSSAEARDKFIKNPLFFLKNNKKPRPIVPLKLAIVGPPKSGKTHLSNRFSEKYGAERLSLGVVTRRILETQPRSNLCSKMLSYLRKGLLLPDELAIEALEVALLNMNCHIKGYVFDGFPFTKYQMELMTARKIIPFKIIMLNIDSTEVVERGAFERLNTSRTYLKHDSGQALAMKYQVFQREIKSVIESYEKEYKNLYNINGKQSKWAVWEQVKKIAVESTWEIQNYLLKIKEDKSASLNGMCVTHKEFLDHLGEFGEFCPVSLALNGELVDCSKDTSMDLVAEFRGYYYKMSTKENLQLFLEEPEQFVPPNAPNALPPVELRPRHLVPQENEVHLELNGYCPVTYLDGKCRYEAIIPGKPSLLAEYKNKFYSFASEQHLDKFMRLPKKYSGLELPQKLPPKIDPMNILELPNLGFMEQTVATPLLRALVAVGDFKPKYPFLTATRSALIYVAYHLKAYNPRNSDYIRKKYQQKLKRFENDCQLIGYLSHHMTNKYINPTKRSEIFNEKIDTFFALKDFEPSLTWIA